MTNILHLYSGSGFNFLMAVKQGKHGKHGIHGKQGKKNVKQG